IITFIALALLLTRSIGALLSFSLALCLYFYLQGRFKKKSIILLLGILLVIGAVFILRASTQKQHLQPVFSTMMRLSYWQDTLKIIKAKPLTGVGIGNFNLMQSRYAHNSYLQIWAEMGILGIISIFLLIIAVFKSAFKNIKGSLDKNQTICLICACAVFLMHNLVDFSFFVPEVSLIWWSIAGLLWGSI
ncbi:MAG: O-antigen ligase family protein, partial [Candidatus Omnitrophota bacterium]|nr:O-antigen ligase family protein [Candidatus Omnitrophota bacterium]